MTDDACMAALSGDRLDPLGDLFERHHAIVFGYLRRLGLAREEADEALQDVFMRVWRYRARYAGRGRFRAWLLAIATRVAWDRLERNRREVSGEPPESAAGPIAHERIEREETISQVRRALLALPPAQRTVIVLSRYHELTYAEIADVVGCSVSAAKVRGHRALRRLAELLQEPTEKEHAG